MKRIGLALATIAAALVAFAAVIAWAVPEDALRRAVSGQIEALTGRSPVIDGPVRLVFVPVPGISVEKIAIPGLPGTPPLLEADAAVGTLDFAALLTGRVRVADLTLFGPHIALVADDKGNSSWGFHTGALAEIAAKNPNVRLPLSSIRLLNGTITYIDLGSGRTARIDVPDATLDWPSPQGDMSLVGMVSWGGHSLDLFAKIADAAVLVAGGQSDIRCKLNGDLVNLAVRGALSSDGRLEGSLNATGPSLRQMVRWLGLRLGEGKSIGEFKLQSPAVIDAKSIALSAVQLELDGNQADGALNVRFDGPRPKISGTLAADTLDISSYSSEWALVDSSPGRWRREPIDLASLALADIDLRLSAGDAVMDKVRLGHIAAAIVASKGLMELSLGEVAAYGGTLKGRLTMALTGDVPKVGANLSFEEVEMGRALGDFLAFHRLEGIGKGSIEVTAVGRSIEDLAASLVGQASFTVRNGALIGVDLADVMRRIERRPLTATLEPRSGRTAFETGAVSFAIDGGVARTTDARLDGGALTVALGGSAGVKARDFDLAGEASFSSNEAGPPFTLPFKITGQWDDPSVSPDPDALIRRSGAAAPLLQGNASAFADTGNGEKHIEMNPLKGQAISP